MAVDEVLSAIIQHKEYVEYLIQTVGAAWRGLSLLPAMPVDGDARLAKVSQQKSGLK